MNKLWMILLAGVILFSCSTTEVNTDEGIRLSRDELINDMFLPSEGVPAGVPDWIDWKHGPRVNYGIYVPEDWNAIYVWGQVYADAEQPNPDVDFPLARVHLKDLQLYIYRGNGTWSLVQNARDPTGDSFVEDFEDNVNKPADIRKEPGGGISIQAGSGFNFHFYPNRKTRINPDDIEGVFAVCKARLIGTESYDTLPKYLINIGGDYWRNTSANWAPDYENNDDIAIGRFKYITTEWQYFTMHTFSLEEAEDIVFPIK